MKTRVLLVVAIAACGSPTRDPVAPPEAPAHAMSITPIDAGTSSEQKPTGDPLELAYRAWFAEGPTPAVIAKFKAIVDAAPQRPQEQPSLIAKVSDDGAIWVIENANSAFSYSVNASTGNPTAQFSAGYGVGASSGDLVLGGFFPKTHLVAIVEKGGDLVVRDLDAKTEALRVSGRQECHAAVTAGRMAYLTSDLPSDAPADRVPKDLTVHVWDAEKRVEIDRFPVEGRPNETGCLRLVTPRVVGVAGEKQPFGIRLRDVESHKDLVTVTGGTKGPVTASTPDGRYILVGTHHGIAVQPPPEKVTLVDTTTGAIAATSSACSAPTSLAVDGKGQSVAVGDVRDVCILGLPKLNLVKRTAALRGPYTKEETDRWHGTWPIRNLSYFGDNALLAFAHDGKCALYKLPGGTIAHMHERCFGGWHVEGSGPSAVAHAFEAGDSTTAVVNLARHVRVMSDLKIVEDKPPKEQMLPALEPALAVTQRMTPRLCFFHDRLIPREACSKLAP